MGITEPLLYGVNLPEKYPLIASMIGGAFGGLYAGLTHTHRFATGSSGLPAVLLYIGDDTMMYFWNILIAIAIYCVVSAGIAFVLSVRCEKASEKESAKEEAAAPAPSIVLTVPGVAQISAPVAGEVKALETAQDPAFASGALGKGCVIEPNDNTVRAPFDGEISALFPTKHAIGLTGDNGIEVLIHVGINTVELNGKHFEAFVSQGDHIKAGHKLITFDREAIAKAGYPTSTMVIVTNSNNYDDVTLANPELALEA